MKECRNNIVLTTLETLNIKELKEGELLKIAEKIAKTININGLRRHVNYTIIQILNVQEASMNNNQKLEAIKNLLNGQKIIETNVRMFKRKTTLATEVKDVPTFINTTILTLKTIKQYQPVKAEKKVQSSETKEAEEKTTKARPTAKVVAPATTKATTATTKTKK